MTKKKSSDNRKAARILARAQAHENREYAADVARVKRAIAGAKFFPWELEEIKRLVFGAYGRTKLQG